MNYNVNTPEGLANAVAWQSAMIAQVADQGRWVVPRSGSIIVIDHKNKQAIRVLGLLPEPTIQKVFEEMGWTWIEQAEK